MKTLPKRLGSSIFLMILLAGLLSIAQLGSVAVAQPTAPTATGQTLSTGVGHSCAIIAGGQVECWGSNMNGQLGDGTTTDRLTPVPVTGLAAPATALAAGDGHTCALLGTGQVACWGLNGDGQLGDGSTDDSTTPVPVTGLSAPATTLAAGAAHSCALLGTGGVECWGLNGGGQLGDGSTVSSAIAVPVTGLAAPATALVAGGRNTCALLNTRLAYCWGDNPFGQLGDGTTTDRATPVPVTGLPAPVTGLTVGTHHACALLDTGQAYCWGRNGNGQLGIGDVMKNDRPIPVQVTDFNAPAAVLTAGFQNTCALFETGSANCWGRNSTGQLGDGTTSDRDIPVPVTGLPAPAAALASGRDHTCALLTTGGVACWGHNEFGQLGDGTTSDRSTPAPVTGLSGPVLQPGAPTDPPVDPPVDPPPTGSSVVGSLQLLGSFGG